MKTSAAVRFMSRCITLGALVALMGCGESGSLSPVSGTTNLGDQAVARSLAKKVLGLTAEESAAADSGGITTEVLVAAAEATEIPATATKPAPVPIGGKKSVGRVADSPELAAARAEMNAAQLVVDAAKVEVDAVKDQPVRLFISADKLAKASELLSLAADKVAKLTPPDVVIPMITSFVLPTLGNSLTVPVTSTVWDDNEVTGWIITTSSIDGINPPSLTDLRWSSKPITSFTVPAGTLSTTLILWVRDAAGNLSWPVQAGTLVDSVAPKSTMFEIAKTAKGLTIPISIFLASDNFTGISGYMVTEDSVPPTVSDARWLAKKPTTYVSTTYGTKRLYAWIKDGVGNISAEKASGGVCINTP